MSSGLNENTRVLLWSASDKHTVNWPLKGVKHLPIQLKGVFCFTSVQNYLLVRFVSFRWLEFPFSLKHSLVKVRLQAVRVFVNQCSQDHKSVFSHVNKERARETESEAERERERKLLTNIHIWSSTSQNWSDIRCLCCFLLSSSATLPSKTCFPTLKSSLSLSIYLSVFLPHFQIWLFDRERLFN